MKVERGASVLEIIFWNALILLPLLDVAEAGPATGLSLNPIQPTACETLTVGWYLINAPSFSIIIADNLNSQTPLFQTQVPTPTSTVEWLVNATSGASLHLLIYPPGLESTQWGPYLDTNMKVEPGSASCALSAAAGPTIPPTSNTATSLSTPNVPTTPQTSTTLAEKLTTTAVPLTTRIEVPSETTSTPSTTGASASVSSASQPPLSTSSIAGISAGMSVVGTCLAIALFMYIRQFRNRRRMARADPFIGRRELQHIQHLDTVVSLDMGSDSGRSEPEVYENSEIHTNRGVESSVMAQVSFVRSNAQDDPTPVSQSRGESFNRLTRTIASEKLRERRPTTPAASASLADGVRGQTDRNNSDLRNTVTWDVDSEFSSPPPYCSHYEET